MLPPERRTRTDLIVAAALAVTVLVAAGVVWWTSEARGTTSRTWDGDVPVLPAPDSLPEELSEVWRAPSSVTFAPVVAGGTVVTADGGLVAGHDPVTGTVRWSYERDRDVCAAAEAWGSVVAVYRDSRGCGQVTELAADSGQREAQRSSDADDAIRLVPGITHLVAAGDTRLEVWRSDLVRTIEYGRVDAPVNPGAQPRSGCTLRSAAVENGRLAVLEHCADELGERLTLLDAVPEDAQKPEEFGSSVLPEAIPGAGARIVGIIGDRTAVYLPPADTDTDIGYIEVFDGAGTSIARHAVDAAVPADPAGFAAAPARERAGVRLWWTGADTVALGADFAPLWTVENTLGSGAVYGDELLLPIDSGIAVVDPSTGSLTRIIAVDRESRGAVSLAVAGDTVLEQRPDEVVALR